MGLFDSLKKSAINKIVDTTGKSIGNTIGKAISNTIENAVGASTKGGGSHESPPQSFAAPRSANPAHSVNPVNSANVDQKFDQILAAEFSELQVIKNASPESIGVSASHPCKPYSYALLRNGKTVAAIMLTAHNRDKNSAFLNARKSALDSKIAFLNFYTHFANERSYVVSRIKNAL